MSVKEIYNCSFSLAPLNESAYNLNLAFTDDQASVVSAKSFTFCQNEHPKEGQILDVYSQNGVCSDAILANLFENRDERDIKKVLKQKLPSGPVVFVLDLQDPHTQYSPCLECHRQ